MFFVERDHMIEDFTATRSHPSLGNSVLPRCLYARLLDFQTRRLQKPDHLGVVSRIAIEDCVTIPTILGSRNCCTTHSAVGCRVTLKWRIFRRPCSMTKKQCNSLNVTDGTVKKSNATITSR